jgi:hypothetical protein
MLHVPRSTTWLDPQGGVLILPVLVCLQNFPIPDEFTNIHNFLKAVKSRDSWAPTAPINDDAVEEGWRTKIKSQKEG